MTSEQRLIFEWIGGIPVVVPNWQERLPELYAKLNVQWFGGALHSLDDSFVCEFCDMPRESAGIFISSQDAARQSTAEITIRPGIRINSALTVLRDHVTIALLHEMIHASGILGHGEDFKAQISRLIAAGAYEGLL